MAQSSEFQYKDSFHEDYIISAYLSLGELAKAQKVIDYLKNTEENWAKARAVHNQELIDKYRLTKELEKEGKSLG
jgi:hypothetical protein